MTHDSPPPASTWRSALLPTVLFVFALAALFLGSIHFDSPLAYQLRVVSGENSGFPPTPFRPLGVYFDTDASRLPKGINTRGSWLGSDEFVGTTTTAAYIARGRFTIMLAGYPALAPNRLELHLRHGDGRTATLPYAGPNPGESWQAWEVTLPETTQEFSIHAVDGSAGARGWLAFSEPYVDVATYARRVWPLGQLAAATCLALVLLQGPGVIWLRQRPRQPRELVIAMSIGPILLGTLGLACWLLGGWIAPAIIARAGVLALLLWIGVGFLRRRRTASELPAGAKPILVAGALLVGFAVAKANVSFGPAGELFGGTISRTLAVGGHSDSRTSYHVVQLVANHDGPFSSAAAGHYTPWSFANRGPLAGLIAAPFVLATGGTALHDAVLQPWQPFDRQGFAVYRISQIVFASLCAWAVFGAIAAVLPSNWATFAGMLALLTPFFAHEMYFTWPKLATAGFVLGSFAQAHHRRPVSAALLLILGYLCHPLALFSIPFLAVWLLARAWTETRDWRCLLAPAMFCAILVPVVAGWMMLGRFAPLRNGAQTVFFDFFRLAHGTLPATTADWWSARWANFANTFLPLHLLTYDRAHESINSVYGPSDRWVQMAFLYWNTLPFALGMPAFLVLLGGVAAACRRAFAVALVTFLAPAALMVVYWGAASSGMMRHCGHVLFISFIALGVWGLAVHAGTWRRGALTLFLHPLCFVWRAGEIALVAFGTTLLHQRPNLAGPFGWNDLVSMIAAGAFLVGAVFVLARSIRLAEIEPQPFSSQT